MSTERLAWWERIPWLRRLDDWWSETERLRDMDDAVPRGAVTDTVSEATS